MNKKTLEMLHEPRPEPDTNSPIRKLIPTKAPQRKQISSGELTSEEVCNIIHACQRGGVSDLTFKNLKISFGQVVNKTVEKQDDGVYLKPLTPRSELEERQMEQMMIDDPSAWERAYIEQQEQ